MSKTLIDKEDTSHITQVILKQESKIKFQETYTTLHPSPAVFKGFKNT
jgi:hypothetical protein